MEIVIELAGIPMRLCMRKDGYFPLLARFQSKKKPLGDVSVSDEELENAKRDCATVENPTPDDTYAEFSEICLRCSDFLTGYGRVVFHGAAFLWHGKAWILTAPPGTGKSTQYVLWKKLWGDEIQMINGDKPVLSVCGNTVTVHPSPWNGKENMGQMISAPLGGIVILRQGMENRIRRLGPDESGKAETIYRQFLYSAESREDVLAVCAMEDTILKHVPLWYFENRGDEDSARVCRAALEAIL